jgi:hypothetical protein
MKYWAELMQLEDASIQLESAVATFKAVNCGIQELSTEEMQLAYWNVEKQLVNIQEQIAADVQNLFETIRDDEIVPKKKGKK